MAITKKTRNKNVDEDTEKRNPHALSVGVYTGATTTDNSIEIPQKIKNRLAIWANYFTSVYVSEEHENIDSKRYMYRYYDQPR